ncbi:MAG: FAD binding domain-containing protein [Hyphomicrobiaceae bacterium]
MKDLVYQRPLTLEHACAALGSPSARLLAGGTDLIVQLREGRRTASQLIDTKYIPCLQSVTTLPSGGISIGAAVCVSKLTCDKRVRSLYPALARAVAMIGSKQIQNRATLGGNICNAAPSADAVPPLVCYGAVCHVVGPSGVRTVPLIEIFAGPGRTSLANSEILRSIEMPLPSRNLAACYMRFTPRREMDIAVAGVGSMIVCEEDGRISDARIVLASVGPKPIRARSAEFELVGQTAQATTFARAGKAAAEEAKPITDTRGSASFRRKLIEVLARRTLASCHGSYLAERVGEV